MGSSSLASIASYVELRKSLEWMQGKTVNQPDASVIIPVNAQSDLHTVLGVLTDISRYTGPHSIEVVLVINNYPTEEPPDAIGAFRDLGIQVVSVPSARRPGEVVIVSARALGAKAARSEVTVHFDADCRVPDVTALLNWYVKMLNGPYQLAYTHVGFYELSRQTAVLVKTALHHSSRWCKRNLFGIPTTRGSNYAVNRSFFLRHYEAGHLSVDMQVGLVAQKEHTRIAYSGNSRLRVLTSGRRNTGRWRRLIPYFLHRLRYNLNVLLMYKRDQPSTTWQGFDEETERRRHLALPGGGHTPGAKQ